MNRAALALILVSLVAFAAAGGFFYAYSISVMRGLDAAPAAAAIEAMQGINREVTNGWFALSFFGAPVYAGLAAILCWIIGQRTTALWMFVALTTYLGGTFAMTVAQHLPRNEALALVEATSANATEIWATYSSEWTLWNHVRTLSSLAATLFCGLGLRAFRPV